uniref:Uncharacterized protein n=1 Tax=Cacopsylla melanoneura TaxID=428564 RepID=A0A8D8TZP0_9HEMI
MYDPKMLGFLLVLASMLYGTINNYFYKGDGTNTNAGVQQNPQKQQAPDVNFPAIPSVNSDLYNQYVQAVAPIIKPSIPAHSSNPQGKPNIDLSNDDKQKLAQSILAELISRYKEQQKLHITSEPSEYVDDLEAQPTLDDLEETIFLPNGMTMKLPKMPKTTKKPVPGPARTGKPSAIIVPNNIKQKTKSKPTTESTKEVHGSSEVKGTMQTTTKTTSTTQKTKASPSTQPTTGDTPTTTSTVTTPSTHETTNYVTTPTTHETPTSVTTPTTHETKTSVTTHTTHETTTSVPSSTTHETTSVPSSTTHETTSVPYTCIRMVIPEVANF